MADENVKPTDGNAKQWDKLQAMRRASGTALTDENGKPNDAAATPGNEQRATKEEIEAEQQRLMAGQPIGGDDDGDDDGDDGDDGDGEETVQVAAHERKKPEVKKPEEKAPDGCEWVEIDGNRVAVDASLAAAYRESETVRATATAEAQNDQLVERIVERVTATLPKAPTPAEAAATRAVETAAEEPLKHPFPDSKLAISDPDAYNAALQAHIDEKSERAAARAVADKDARDAAARQTTQTEAARQQEAWAREQLGIQFYRQFKVLDDASVKPLVDVMLQKKFDEVISSGALSKPLPPKEAETMKMRAFNAVAAEATRAIVKLRGQSGATPPAAAPEPPKVVTGQANKGPRAKTAAPPVKPKEKYPTGSVSAMLAAHKAKKESPNHRP